MILDQSRHFFAQLGRNIEERLFFPVCYLIRRIYFGYFFTTPELFQILIHKSEIHFGKLSKIPLRLKNNLPK